MTLMSRTSIAAALSLVLAFGLIACDQTSFEASNEEKGVDYEAVVESVENDSTINVGEVSPWELNADTDRIGPGGLENPAIDTVYAIESTTVRDSAQMTGTITVARPFDSTPSTGARLKVGK